MDKADYSSYHCRRKWVLGFSSGFDSPEDIKRRLPADYKQVGIGQIDIDKIALYLRNKG